MGTGTPRGVEANEGRLTRAARGRRASLETRSRIARRALARRLSPCITASRPRAGLRASSLAAMSCRHRAASVPHRSSLSAAASCASRRSADLARCCCRSRRAALSARWRQCASSGLGRRVALALCGEHVGQLGAPDKPGRSASDAALGVPGDSASFRRVSTAAVGGGASGGDSGGGTSSSPSLASHAPSCRSCPRSCSRSRRASPHSRCTITSGGDSGGGASPRPFSASLEATCKPGEPSDAAPSARLVSTGSAAADARDMAPSSPCNASDLPRSRRAACRRSLTSRSSRPISALVPREGVHNLGVVKQAGWLEAHRLHALSVSSRARRVCQAQAASSSVERRAAW